MAAVSEDLIRSAIRILIVILCAAALLLIVVILSGSRLDDTSGKAILTAVGFAFYMLCMTAGARLSDREPLEVLFGYLVIGVALIGFLTLTFALWTENGDGELAGTFLIFSLGGGHASLLLRGARAEDSDGARVVRICIFVAIVVLCLLGTREISENGNDIDARVIGVVAVVYVLATALLPLVRRESGSSAVGAVPSTAEELLRGNGHVLVEGPIARGGTHGAGQSVCLREPDGTLIELITYDRNEA